MKHFFCNLTSMYKYLFLLLPFLSFGQSPNSLLWEISGNGLEKPSYLFGTIHRNDRELFNFSDSTYVALEKVDGIMLEVDISSFFDSYDSNYGNVRFTFDRNGKPYVKNVFDSQTKFGSEAGFPQFMDAYFQQYGENAEKDFYALKTFEEQKGVIWKPYENAFQYDELYKNDQKAIQLYLKGELFVLDRYIHENQIGYDEDYKKQIDVGNLKMVSKLDTILRSQRSVFCAVGADHLAGKSGFIELLMEMGYSVRRVESASSEINEAKQKVKSFSFYPLEIDSLKLSAIFPGEPLLVKSDEEDYDFKYIYREYGQGNTYILEFYSLKEKENLTDLAEKYIACPEESLFYKVELNNGYGGEGIEGLSDAYPQGYFWTRILLSQDYFVVLKSYGGKRFMASQRAQRFFQQVELD